MEMNRNKINLAMSRKGFTIAKLAAVYGVSDQRMRVILNSKKVSPATVKRMADALDVDVTEIIETKN